MLIKQSSTAYPLCFKLIDSVTGAAATGKTATVTLSKAGGSFASPSGAVSEIANGWYKVAGNATDTGTLGQLILYATASGCVDADVKFEVVAFDPQVSTVSLGASQGDITFNSVTITGLLEIDDGINVVASTSNRSAISLTGTGNGSALRLTPGTTGNGLRINGGSTSGAAVRFVALASNSVGLDIVGVGSSAGMTITGGTTGAGAIITGGATSGSSVSLVNTSGNALQINGTNFAAQTGDSYTRIGSNGASLTALATAASVASLPVFSDISRATLGVKMWFVAKTGSDANAGTPSAPFLTINAALTAASEGDYIIILPGTYDENVDMQNKACHLRGTCPETCIIAPSSSWPVQVAHAGWTIKYLTLTGADSQALNDTLGGKMGLVEWCYLNGGAATYAVDIGDSSSVVIRHCVITGQRSGFNLSGGGWTIENCRITLTITDNSEVYGYNVSGTGIIRNCQMIMNRTAASVGPFETIGIRVGSSASIELSGGEISVTNHASETGTVSCVKNRATGSYVKLNDITLRTSSTGSNTRYKLNNAIGGTMIDDGGVSYSSGDVTGTITVGRADNRNGEEISDSSGTGDASEATLERIIRIVEGRS